MTNTPGVTPITMTAAPPQHIVEFAVEASMCSPCRSKRGVAIFRGDDLVTTGLNFKPRQFPCDQSDACKASCRFDAVHAEQMALLTTGDARDADMLHVKTVNGALVPSGLPSCAACSKLMLAAGIRFIWLFHESGWRRYSAEDFHRLSIDNDQTKREIDACHQRLQTLTQELEDASQERYQLKACLLDYEELEAKCCPEDVGFKEYIESLQKQIQTLTQERDEAVRLAHDAAAACRVADEALAAERTKREQAEQAINALASKGLDVCVLVDAYGWDVNCETGEVWGLTAGDMGYEPCGIRLETVPQMAKESEERDALRARLDALEQAQTCETCRFADEPGVNRRPCRYDEFMYTRHDVLADMIDSRRVIDSIVWVPLTIHGQPFGCKGWHAKADPPSPGGETK